MLLVELKRLIVVGEVLVERRDAMEFFRDDAAELFEAPTGSTCQGRIRRRGRLRLAIFRQGPA
jgi:hypothetical protein